MIRSVMRSAIVGLLLFAGCASGGDGPAAPAEAAVVLRVTVPSTTPPGATVYVAGDFNGWDPASPAHALVEVAPLTHALTLSFPVGRHVEFKFTRGGWETVEKDASGNELPNRVADVTGPLELDLEIAAWADAP